MSGVARAFEAAAERQGTSVGELLAAIERLPVIEAAPPHLVGLLCDGDAASRSLVTRGSWAVAAGGGALVRVHEPDMAGVVVGAAS